MNHAGEITPLVGLVRPQIALVTNCGGGAPRAFRLRSTRSPTPRRRSSPGWSPGGVAIINRDIDTYARLRAHVPRPRRPAHVLTFGEHADADARLADCIAERGRARTCPPACWGGASTSTSARPAGTSPSTPSACCWPRGPRASTSIRPPPRSAGRGPARGGAPARASMLGGGTATLIDESYNANPTSMRAALAVLGRVASRAARAAASP